MNFGGNVAVLYGDKSYVQNKETGQRTRIENEGGQHVMYLRMPYRRIKDEEENKMLKGNKFEILATEEVNDEGF